MGVELAFPKLEKKVLITALVTSAIHLLLIAFAATQLGITVPTCFSDGSRPLDQAAFIKKTDDHFEVQILAKMWSFEPSKIRIPVGSRLDIFLTSLDVVHGFFIKGTNINLMAVPGSIANASHVFRQPGEYQVICHEYCGVGHQNMFATIEVVEEGEGEAFGMTYSQSSAPDPGKAASETDDPGAKGAALYSQKGCIACHSISGEAGVGPTLKGVFGTSVELSDGSKVIADEAYLKESILDPHAKLHKGFGPIMPKLPLTDTEVQELISYIKSIK